MNVQVAAKVVEAAHVVQTVPLRLYPEEQVKPVFVVPLILHVKVQVAQAEQIVPFIP